MWNGLKMQFLNFPNPLIVIVGPTAVGKTAIAIEVAKQVGGEIVSADSRLFYRGMDIGTAKPTPGERSSVPHHLIDVADPDETWSLTVFQNEASKVIREIHERGNIPLLVGGTGQYIQSVLEGWEVPAQKPDERMRLFLQGWGEELGYLELHRKLSLVDPTAAAFIQAQNMRRTIRALEVIFLTGKRFSDLRKKKSSPYSHLIVGLNMPRPELYSRIDARIETMFESGFVEEVKCLLKKNYSPELPTLSAIGYHEVIDYLRGNLTLDEAKRLMKRKTRQYVRQQANWFKERDPQTHWFNVGETTVDDIVSLIRSGRGWIPQRKDEE
jgi:tRNA dimethylallyltransferase